MLYVQRAFAYFKVTFINVLLHSTPNMHGNVQVYIADAHDVCARGWHFAFSCMVS